MLDYAVSFLAASISVDFGKFVVLFGKQCLVGHFSRKRFKQVWRKALLRPEIHLRARADHTTHRVFA